MSSSIKWSLIRGGLGDCRMKTSSSRTDEWIWTEVSSDRNFETWHGVRAMPSLQIRTVEVEVGQVKQGDSRGQSDDPSAHAPLISDKRSSS